MIFFFFFSSRRRHTRFKCDWSSDVCSSDLPPGAGNQFHRHPGDQWWAVQEGEVTFTVKGQPPRLMKAGDYVYVPRGTIPRNQNVSKSPARSIELNITDKDKPQTEQVP